VIDRHDWFHTIDFGDGIVTPGHCTSAVLKAKADSYFNVEALRRGASRVLYTDHYVWNVQWSRGAFDLVRERLAPELEVADIDVYDLSPSAVGTFEIVLFTGLLYPHEAPAARAGRQRLRGCTRACLQLRGLARERIGIKHGTPF
jgi:hypothetical protein